MMRTKLFKLVACNRPVALMSTSTEIASKDKKLEHYRNLQSLEDTESKPQGWDQAKPFSEIPGLKPTPLLGSVWRFALPVLGIFNKKDIVEMNTDLQKKYGDIVLLSGVRDGEDMVILYNPKDFESLFRNEGLWPIRKNLPSLDIYRKSREHKWPNSGLVSQHGEKWFQFRSTVNPILMQPRNIAQYAEKMDAVASELIDNIKFLSEQNPNGEMPSDFMNELYKWALESVGVVTLDRHLGTLQRNLPKDSEPQKIINSVTKMFDLIFKLDIKPSLYKYISTPNWRTFTKEMDFIIGTTVKHINVALEQLKKEPLDSGNEFKSVLQQLLKKDKDVALSMAIDMLVAGIDTTGRILGAGLYYLSRYPASQEELRKEAKTLLPNKDTPITKEILAKAKYLKACLKEVTRLAPIGVGNARTTVKDLVIAGYQIPKGTNLVTANLNACLNDKYFPRSKEFLPERWLKSAPEELSHKHANPFVYQPFGFGPRSCVGKRLATFELETAMLKIVRNFELTWPHEDMVFATTTLYGIARPLKIRVRSVEN